MTKYASRMNHQIDGFVKQTTVLPPKPMASCDQLAAKNEKRTRGETVLHKKEKRFRTIVENLINGIFVTDGDGKIVYLNEKVCDIFGYAHDEMMGRNFFDFLTREGRQPAVDRYKMRLVTEDSNHPQEFHIVTKNGEKRCIEAIATIIDAAEKNQQTIVQIIDITYQNRLTDHLQQIHKMEAISDLAGGIAHQFNNALSGIMGNISLIELICTPDQKISKYTAKINDCVHRMTQLTSQLLAYAQAGKYRPRKLFLCDLIRDTLPLIQNATNPAIKIKMDSPTEDIPINCDLAQMQMVLMAVLANASEAIEDQGQIRITVTHQKITHMATIDLPDLKPGDYVRLTVADNGKGMDKNAQKRIFDPFFTTRFLGRGLGMAAVYGIIKNHGGGITVESKPDQGTIVKIYLPSIPNLPAKQRHRASSERKKQAQPANSPDQPPDTILVVEDDEDVMAVNRALLEKLNYHVLVARTGQEAIQFVRAIDTRINLVLLDIGLPDMSGNDIYPILMKARPDLKVVVCSGQPMDGPVQKIMDAGARDFIQKPFSFEKISEKLERIIKNN